MTAMTRMHEAIWRRPFKVQRPESLTGRIVLRVAAGICLFVCAISASATRVSYLETPGVTGPVDASGFSGAFDVDFFFFSVGAHSTGSLGVEIPSSEAAPLAAAAAVGRHFPHVFLDEFNETSSTIAYFEATVGDAFIASISSGGGATDEEIIFDFSRISLTEGTCGHGVTCPSFSSVPEPGTLALLGLGLFGVGVTRRRLRR